MTQRSAGAIHGRPLVKALMSELVGNFLGWLRRTLGFSTSRRSWQERAGLAFIVLAALCGWLYVRRLEPSLQVVFWGFVLVTVAVLLRRGWLKLFGPVLFYDLLRTARRDRYFVLRGLYMLLLLGLLCWVWYVWWVGREFHGNKPARGPGDLADFGASFFYTFMATQFLIVSVLTPAYVAGAVADEKERRTLEFLLATDLRDREIVLSKLFARLLNLGMLVLAGLPVLAILQLLGGAGPDLVLAGNAATLLTMASLGGVSILFSVLVRRGRDAIILSYLAVLAYLLVGVLTMFIPGGWLLFPSTAGWLSPVTLGDLIDWYNAGNIVVALRKLGSGMRPGAPPGTSLPEVLRAYASFHGVVAVGCSTWALLRLRAVALKEAGGRTARIPLPVRLFGRPRIGRRPMVWKELFAEPKLRFHWVGKLLLGLLFLASFLPAALILYDFIDSAYLGGGYRGMGKWGDPYWRLSREMNIWARIVGSGVACLLLVGVAVRAAGSISGERDRQTFDSLLTSPLDSGDILFGKWLGSVLSMRWGWLWLALIYGLGLVTGGVYPLALPVLVGAWLILAGFCAVVGLWFSTVCRTGLRSTVWTLLTLVGLWVGHWLIWMCCMPILIAGRSGRTPFEDVLEYVAKFQAFGLTPPLTLGWLAFHAEDIDMYAPGKRNEPLEFTICAMLGLVVWTAGGLLWYLATEYRLRKLTMRTPLRRPDKPFRRRPPAALPVVRAVPESSDGIVTVTALEIVDVLPAGPPPNRDGIALPDRGRQDKSRPPDEGTTADS